MSTAVNSENGKDTEAQGDDADRAAAATAELKDLVDRVDRGEAFARARLCRLMDEHPEIWEHCGDLIHAPVEGVCLSPTSPKWG